MDGFHSVLWDSRIIGDSVRFSYLSVDGEEGYPGNLRAEVTYIWSDADELMIELKAVTDKPTIVNLTNHAYFNLSGEDGGSCLGHRLRLYCSKWLPADEPFGKSGRRYADYDGVALECQGAPYWIHFKGELAKYYAQDAIEPKSINPSIHSRISNRINMFEELFNTLNSSYSMESIRYAMTLFHHYLGSLRYINQYREVGVRPESGDAVEAAIHFMKENIERHLTLQEVADYIGYSASHFSMIFKDKTGHSPLTYFNLLKIRQACYLLDNTSMKLNQVCYKLGIDDPYYFSRLFTKIMGMSPRAYRLLQKV